LVWPIDTELGVWVAYVCYPNLVFGIATQVSVIKVKVTIAKNKKSVSAFKYHEV